MQAFIAEIKANRTKKSRWRGSDKKSYEENFIALISKGPQTMESVVAEIEKTWLLWEERPEKLEGAKRNLLRFCENFNCFSTVFDLIPNQSLHTGMLCGALKLLINERNPALHYFPTLTNDCVKASINHEAMAEVFSRALAEIS